MAVTVPSFIPTPFAREGQFAVIPDAPSSEQGRASWQQGFPQVCAQPLASGGIPPNYLDFQGIFNALSAAVCYMQTGALWPWSATLTYPLGAHVLGSDNNEYVAVQENTGQDPTTDTMATYWASAVSDSIAVGTIIWSAADNPPEGYLICNGAAVGRTTYPDLFSKIGTTYGEGDGSTTFNLPNLIGRVAWGGATPGQYLEAGLPNITGTLGGLSHFPATGAFYTAGDVAVISGAVGQGGGAIATYCDASRSNSIYGNSTTVQPPALTLTPYIKAFSAATNPGEVNITELATSIENSVLQVNSRIDALQTTLNQDALQTTLNQKAPLPQAAEGVGEWRSLHVIASSISLPPKGVWAYHFIGVPHPSGSVLEVIDGVKAGGSEVPAARPETRAILGLVWRIA